MINKQTSLQEQQPQRNEIEKCGLATKPDHDTAHGTTTFTDQSEM
jgi:hypothetical protein